MMSDQAELVHFDSEEELPPASSSSSASPGNRAMSNSRHRPCYRTEWENMPHLKDWLKPIPDDPTRAFCVYCKRTLYAQLMNLLEHACTIKHSRAYITVHASKANENNSDEDVDYPNIESYDGGDEEDLNISPEKVARIIGVPPLPHITWPPLPHITWPPLPHGKITTYVVDTVKGSPVAGLHVSLYKLIEGQWRILREGYTNMDGHFSQFIQGDTVLTSGRYKVHFDVDRYFLVSMQESMFPFVEVVFDVQSANKNYHIPLVLTPYGFTVHHGNM